MMGRGAFRMQLGPVERLQEAIVADIEDDVLLGYDVLENAESPADIILSSGIISLEGQEIPCIQERLRQMQKVTVAEEASAQGNYGAVLEVYVEREEAESIDRVASVVSDKEREDDTTALSIRRIDIRHQHEGHASGKVEEFKHTINTNDSALVKQLCHRARLTYSDVARNAKEVIKKKCVCQKRTSPWVSRLVRVKKKFITSRDGRTLSLPYSINKPSDCFCHDYNGNETRISSEMVSPLMSDINFECACDPGCSERGQTSDLRHCVQLHALDIRRSTPHRMLYGPFYQRHHTIHPTQDFVWAILPEASDDPLHTGCHMGHSTRGISRPTSHRMSDESIHHRLWTLVSCSGNNMEKKM
ncbi:hypothetical protein DPMN_094314 [Dreissena polymorpha]|uniref:Uncharacterized protein n=1 Tax=Dreissena polymorpha TaxID=45954 RepID=A0A9D4L4J5_DREPO|nr:hypothetical protein DPMN_094314 [Dreissena polymorpha]